MNQKFSLLCSLLIASLSITACSSGGGGVSSAASSQASGPLSVPSATCGGSACLGASSFAASTPFLTSSGTNTLSAATQIYRYVTQTVIPGINTTMYRVEKAAADNGLQTCAQIAAAADDQGGSILGYTLGDGYTVDISNLATKAIPAGMTDAGTSMTKKFIFSKGGTKFAEVQIKCNSSTERTFYVRVQESASKIYEFWPQSDGVKREIFGAFDNGSLSKSSLYFKTVDGVSFQLHTIANSVEVNGATSTFAISGGANLAAGTADVASLQSDVNAVASSLSYQDDSYSGADPRHCYSSVSPVTVTPAASAGSCGSLLGSAGPASAIRSGSAWSMNGMNTPISASF